MAQFESLENHAETIENEAILVVEPTEPEEETTEVEDEEDDDAPMEEPDGENEAE